MICESTRGDYLISTNPARLDLGVIRDFLARSYWSEDIPVDIVKRSIEGSIAFGVYYREKQVGFARVITDGATFAYLADVFILEQYRGQGLAKWLMEFILQHRQLQNLRRFLLVTRDAHDLYRRFGFKELDQSERFMEIAVPRIYKGMKS